MVLVILKHTVFQSYMWRIICLQGGKFSFNRWWIGKISDAEEGKIAMSCKPISDHERVIWLETFFYSTTLLAYNTIRGLERGRG